MYRQRLGVMYNCFYSRGFFDVLVVVELVGVGFVSSFDLVDIGDEVPEHEAFDKVFGSKNVLINLIPFAALFDSYVHTTRRQCSAQ